MLPITHLVVLQIPTLDLLVFSTGEEVGAAAADSYTAHRADVSGQREFQLPTSQVPNLSNNPHYSHVRIIIEHFYIIQITL